VRADVEGDKRSLCVEHARRDGRGDLVWGGGKGGGEGGESREKELMWWAYGAVRMEEEMKEDWREACASDQEMVPDIDEEEPIEIDDEDSHLDIISTSDDADSDLEEDLKSSSEEEDEDLSAYDIIDASGGEIRGKAEKEKEEEKEEEKEVEKEEEERAGLVPIKATCLPRSVEITNSGLHVFTSQYIVALKSKYTKALTFEYFRQSSPAFDCRRPLVQHPMRSVWQMLFWVN
jgi:hypothetical protein